MNQSGINAILTLFILRGVGLAPKKTGTMTQAAEGFITKLLQQVSIPALMFYNATTQFNERFLREYYPGIIVSFLTLMASIIAGLAVAKLFKIKEKDTGVFTTMFAFSNTIFIGVPVISGIFGEQGIPYLMLFYLMNTVLFWTMGIFLIGGEKGSNLFSRATLKKLFNPAMNAFLLGLVLMYTKTTVPDPILRSLDYLSGLVTPLSTLYMGSIIAEFSFKRLPGLKPTLLVLFGRFVFSPFLALTILKLFGFSGLMVQVIVIASALPVMSQVSILAGYYGKDKQYTAFMTALTTLLSIFILPFYFNFM